MDVLSAVLRELHLESAGYRWLELGSPFRVTFDRPGLRGVHIVARGSCELVAEGSARRLAAGDLVVLPRGDAHELRSTVGAAGGVRRAAVSGFELAMRTPGTRLKAGGPGEETVVVCGAFLAGEPGHPALRGLPALLHVPGEGGRPAPWLATLIDAISMEAFDGGPGSDLVMARLSDALLVRALRHHATVADRPGWLAGLADPVVAVALAVVHEDPARPWTIGRLAAEAGLSRAAFAARFARCVGEPPMRYVIALRMQRARTLLRDRSRTVSAVARETGYGSDVAFAAAFKRETGVSPSAYRQMSAS
jgi:AraC-like DNA-binding protein